MENKSPAGVVSKADIKSLGRGLLITLAGAAVAYITKVLADMDWTQFGAYAPILTSVSALVINFIRKWLSGYPQY